MLRLNTLLACVVGVVGQAANREVCAASGTERCASPGSLPAAPDHLLIQLRQRGAKADGREATCAEPWAQCGGNGWTGPTCCTCGYTCELQDQWWSSCKPGGAACGAPTLPPTSPPTTPPTSETTEAPAGSPKMCSGISGAKRSCSADGCRVLAETGGGSCDEFCRASGRACVGAWEEVSDDCEVKFPWSCERPLAETSDLLCECSHEAGAPGGGGDTKMCSSMPDVKRECSSNGCRVLAETRGRSCRDYCRASGRACVGAWEEVSDDCAAKFQWSCDEPLADTSDMICECGTEVGPIDDDDAKTCSGMAGVKRSCSADGCRVLAETGGGSCAAFCGASGRSCVAAWEEVNDDCNVQFPWSCDRPLAETSDLLCECGPSGSGGAVATTRSPEGPGGSRLVWADEFDGGEVDRSRWEVVSGGGGFGNQERQRYSSRNAVVEGGALRIVAKCDDYKGYRYTSAKLKSRGSAKWGPGHRVEVRARMSTGRGTWPAIWMLPKDKVYGGWPKSGEIDIMEAVGCTPNRVYGTVHTGRYNHMKGTEKSDDLGVDVSEWHTYSIEWRDREIRWFVDDRQYHTFSPSAFDSNRWPFDQDFYLILNVAVGGTWGGYCISGGKPSCSDSRDFGRDQMMEVDYARVFSLD